MNQIVKFISDYGFRCDLYNDFIYYLDEAISELHNILNVNKGDIILNYDNISCNQCIKHKLSYEYILTISDRILCRIPRMTEECYFIINGQERVIVSREKKKSNALITYKDTVFNNIKYRCISKYRFNGCIRTTSIGIHDRSVYLIINKDNKDEYDDNNPKGYHLLSIIKQLNIDVNIMLSNNKYKDELRLMMLKTSEVPEVVITNRFKRTDMESIQLSYILERTMDIYYNKSTPTDLNDYRYKEILTPGFLYKRQILRCFRKGSNNIYNMQSKLSDLYNSILRGDLLTVGRSVKSFSISLGRRSKIDTINSVRRIVLQSDINSPDENMRYIHESQFMYICPSDTPESKEVGITKSYALTCLVSKSADPYVVMNALNGSTYGDIPIYIDGMKSFYIPYNSITYIDKLVYNSIHTRHYITSGNYIDGIYIGCSRSRLVRPTSYDKDNITFTDIYTDNKSMIHGIQMCGFISSQIPFVNHNPGVRSVYTTSILKQSLCTITDNMMYDLKYMPYAHKSLCNTSISNIMEEVMLNTTNVIISIGSIYGYNQEDSILLNKASIDRGLFNSIHRTVTSITILNISPMRILVSKGQRVKLGDTVAVYIEVSESILNTRIVTFNSKTSYPYVVTNIDVSELTSSKCYSITCERLVSLSVGDKLSSKHGQKGIVSKILSQEDIPTSIHGITPDIIINPHAMPSRKTMGHILEMVVGKCHSRYDATGFNNVNINNIKDQLRRCGMSPDGTETMICPYTGIYYRERVYTGVCGYLLLKHFAAEKIRHRDNNLRSTYSHQPLSGHEGAGLRVGEMEIDCIISHGCLDMLYNIVTDSDRIDCFICASCGVMVDSDVCRMCNIDSRKITIPYSLKMFNNTLASLNILMRFNID